MNTAIHEKFCNLHDFDFQSILCTVDYARRLLSAVMSYS